MSKVRLTGSNSGYVEIAAIADAGNLTFTMPNSGTSLLGNSNNTLSGVTTTGQLDLNGSIDVSSTSVFNDDLTLSGASYNVVWDKSDNQLEFGANAKLSFGASSGFQLYHDGSNSYIDDAGELRIRGTYVKIRGINDEDGLIFTQNGSIQLKHNNNLKLETANTGVVISGICTATSFSGDGSALTNTGAASYNAIINGEMLISQRGGDFSSVNSTAYHLDRWQLYYQNSSAAFRIRHSGDSPDGFHQSYRLNVTTADTSIASNEEVKLLHKIEGINLAPFAKGTSGAKKFTLSFYVKCNKTGTYIVELYDRDNAREVSGSYTVSNTNWNRYTIDFPADTTGEFGFDHGSSLELMFWLVAGSAVQGGTLNTAWRSAADPSSATGQVNFTDSTSNEWMLTGVQLEPTTTGIAKDFKHEIISETLAKCQRYYWQLTQDGGGNALYIAPSVGYGSGNYNLVAIANPVEMRVPVNSVTTSGTASHYQFWGGNSVVDLDSAPSLRVTNSKNQTTLDCTKNIASGETRMLRIKASTSAYIGFSAEL